MPIIAKIVRPKIVHRLLPFFAGILLPLGFAPFHLPGFSLISIAFLYALLKGQTAKRAAFIGFAYGLGFLGAGVSWVYISIHDYGHLNALISGLITLVFIVYLALYPALVAGLYSKLSRNNSLFVSCLLFSALWCIGEYLRSTFLSGFPWLLLGFGQIDTPLQYVLPIVGVYGVSFLACLSATCLVSATRTIHYKQYAYLIAFTGILLIPSLLKDTKWTKTSATPLTVAIIQANLSMRDKWDEALFWELINQYKKSFDLLVGKKDLIVMPESAIPLPESYVSDLLDNIHLQSVKAGSSLLLGIPQPTNGSETQYYNTMLALGKAEGHYLKQHLVPFGEYIPDMFNQLMQWLSLPSANIKPGRQEQTLIRVHDHPIATLICYELAYPDLLRKQLPEAEWIVSISDDGWFGHSLAIYQQLQMAQVLSLQTGRFQVVSNNDGLSSVINTRGQITASLPAFRQGILEATIYPATGATPWVSYGDAPVLLSCFLIVLLVLIRRYKVRHL